MVVMFKFAVDVDKLSFDRWQGFYKLCLGVCALLLYCCEHVKGVVNISPSVVAPVCQVGEQVELTCTTSGTFLRWTFTTISESGQAVDYMRTVSSGGSSGVVSEPLIINSTMITFSRLSNQSSLPLVSRMTINAVSEGLNGTRVNCVDVVNMTESAATTIHIIGDTQQTTVLSIPPHSEEFLSDRVVVMLKWTLDLSNLNRYQLLLLPNVTINVLNSEVIVKFVGNMSVQLTLPYNRLYNVSITQPGVCGQPNQTAFVELNYSKCSNLSKLIHTDVIVMGYEDPALEGENITFICPPESALNGPNSSICMGNGEWEPDPKEVKCTGTSTTVASSTEPGTLDTLDPTSRDSLTLPLAIVFSILGAGIVAIIIVILFAIALKRKGNVKFRTREIECTGDDTEIHMYSQLHHNFKQQTINSSIFAHDDNNVEYATLNGNEDNCPPVNLDNLLVQLRSQVGPKWYQFGEAAGIEKEALNKFVEQCSSQDCIVEMLDYWLRISEKRPTWKDVAELLKAINLMELGLEIERVYTTGMLPIQVDMNWIPKLDTETEDTPPPLPERDSTLASLLSKETPAPPLPPKPTQMLS